ncbi:MAG: hypothetical protein CM1200mP2_18850 [Planctomycetaceae bacterium]|nr:MAG: hypothetical protein CM1200mP2_18850 [Planctomycetaceae bacterium]
MNSTTAHWPCTSIGRGGYKWNAYLIRSTNRGKTWGDPTQVPTRTDSDEISYEYLPEQKRIYGVTRSSAAQIRRVKSFADQVPGGKNAPRGFPKPVTRPSSSIPTTRDGPGPTRFPLAWVSCRRPEPTR